MLLNLGVLLSIIILLELFLIIHYAYTLVLEIK